jgi:hypothetical protein
LLLPYGEEQRTLEHWKELEALPYWKRFHGLSSKVQQIFQIVKDSSKKVPQGRGCGPFLFLGQVARQQIDRDWSK